MVGRDDPIAPPTRNEDKPGSCEVKHNRAREKENRNGQGQIGREGQ